MFGKSSLEIENCLEELLNIALFLLQNFLETSKPEPNMF